MKNTHMKKVRKVCSKKRAEHTTECRENCTHAMLALAPVSLNDGDRTSPPVIHLLLICLFTLPVCCPPSLSGCFNVPSPSHDEMPTFLFYLSKLFCSGVELRRQREACVVSERLRGRERRREWGWGKEEGGEDVCVCEWRK